MADIAIRYVGDDKTKAASESARKNIAGVSSATKDAQQSLNALGKEAGGVQGALRALGGGFRDARTSTDNLTGGINLLKGGIAALGVTLGAGALLQGTRALVELTKQAAGVQALRGSFDSLAANVGVNSRQMLADLKVASRGMVSEQDLILAANRAMMLGVADTSEEMAQLMEIAIARGTAMGLSATQAFNDLVTGLGRMSPMILDNLGIVTGGEKVFEEYARSIGKASDALTDAERKQALFSKVVAESEGMIVGAGAANLQAVQSMSAAWADLKVAVGELASPVIISGIQALTGAIQGLNAAADQTQARVELAAITGPNEWLRQLEVMREKTEQLNEGWMQEILRFPGAMAEVDRLIAEGMARGLEGSAFQIISQLQQMGEVIPEVAFSLAVYKDATEQAEAELAKLEERHNALQASVVMFANESRAATAELESQAQAAANAQRAITEAMIANVESRRASIAQIADDYKAQIDRLTRSLVPDVGAQAALNLNAGLKSALEENLRLLEMFGYDAERIAYEMIGWFDREAEAAKKMAEGTLEAALSTNNLAVAFDILLPAMLGVTSQAELLGIVLGEAVVEGAQVAKGAIADMVSYASSALSAVTGMLGAISTADLRPDRRTAPPPRPPGAPGTAITKGNTSRPPASHTRLPPMQGAKAFNSQALAANGISTMGQAAERAASALGDLRGEARNLEGRMQGMLQNVPGLFGTSQVTEEQMRLAELGVPQNFADNYLRRLTDEVMNGVDWEGVDIQDAAARAGIDPNLPAQAILQLFTQAWRDSSLFANAANLELIDQQAVQEAIQKQLDAEQGKLNIMEMMGIDTKDAEAELAALGAQFRDYMTGGVGDGEGMSDAAGPYISNIGSQLGSADAVAAQEELGRNIAERVNKGFVRAAQNLVWGPPTDGGAWTPPSGAPSTPQEGNATGAARPPGGTSSTPIGATANFYVSVSDPIGEAQLRNKVRGWIREFSR